MPFLSTVLGVTTVPDGAGDVVLTTDAYSAATTTAVATTNTILASAGFSTMDFFGLFNIFVGLMIVASILIFVAGLITWWVRIGTIGRVEGVRTMEWGVVILFVLIVMLAIIQFFQRNPWVATFFVSLVIICFVLWLIMLASKGGDKKEEH